jgi:DNA-binding GntR family transcriptional regulator
LPTAGVRGRLTETQRVYQDLKRAILAGDYRPGEPLQEVRLSAEMGASRTPVREALQRLESDGLLTITPRRGAFVQQPTLRDFLDINELRVLLEPAAARAATGLLSQSVVAELRGAFEAISCDAPEEDDFAALRELDGRLHRTFTETIPNVRMAKIINGLNDMMQTVRETDMRRRHRELHLSIGEVLEAIERRDADAVETSMRRHVADFGGALRGLL